MLAIPMLRMKLHQLFPITEIQNEIWCLQLLIKQLNTRLKMFYSELQQ